MKEPTTKSELEAALKKLRKAHKKWPDADRALTIKRYEDKLKGLAKNEIR